MNIFKDKYDLKDEDKQPLAANEETASKQEETEDPPVTTEPEEETEKVNETEEIIESEDNVSGHVIDVQRLKQFTRRFIVIK